MTWKIDNCIEDYEHGYPFSEARFGSVRAWEEYMHKNGFVYECWRVELGACFEYDCRLVLVEPRGLGNIRHTYSIESEGWIALSEFWNSKEGRGFVPVARAKEILEMGS